MTQGFYLLHGLLSIRFFFKIKSDYNNYSTKIHKYIFLDIMMPASRENELGIPSSYLVPSTLPSSLNATILLNPQRIPLKLCEVKELI